MGLKEIIQRVSDAIDPPSTEISEAQRLLMKYRAETKKNEGGKPFGYGDKPGDFPGGRAILDSAPEMQLAVLRELMAHKNSDKYDSPFRPLKDQLLVRKLPLSLADVEALLEQAAKKSSWAGHWGAAIRKTRHYLEDARELTPALTAGLNAIRTQATAYNSADNRKFVMQIDELLGNNKQVQPDAGEAWANKALSDLGAMTPEARPAWDALFAHALTAESGKPSAKWLAEAARHREAIGEAKLSQYLIAWLNLTAPPPAFEETAPRYDTLTMRPKTPEYDAYYALYQKYHTRLRA